MCDNGVIMWLSVVLIKLACLPVLHCAYKYMYPENGDPLLLIVVNCVSCSRLLSGFTIS